MISWAYYENIIYVQGHVNLFLRQDVYRGSYNWVWFNWEEKNLKCWFEKVFTRRWNLTWAALKCANPASCNRFVKGAESSSSSSWIVTIFCGHCESSSSSSLQFSQGGEIIVIVIIITISSITTNFSSYTFQRRNVGYRTQVKNSEIRKIMKIPQKSILCNHDFVLAASLQITERHLLTFWTFLLLLLVWWCFKVRAGQGTISILPTGIFLLCVVCNVSMIFRMIRISKSWVAFTAFAFWKIFPIHFLFFQGSDFISPNARATSLYSISIALSLKRLFFHLNLTNLILSVGSILMICKYKNIKIQKYKCKIEILFYQGAAFCVALALMILTCLILLCPKTKKRFLKNLFLSFASWFSFAPKQTKYFLCICTSWVLTRRDLNIKAILFQTFLSVCQELMVIWPLWCVSHQNIDVTVDSFQGPMGKEEVGLGEAPRKVEAVFSWSSWSSWEEGEVVNWAGGEGGGTGEEDWVRGDRGNS